MQNFHLQAKLRNQHVGKYLRQADSMPTFDLHAENQGNPAGLAVFSSPSHPHGIVPQSRAGMQLLEDNSANMPNVGSPNQHFDRHDLQREIAMK